MRDEVIEEIRERRKRIIKEDYGGSFDQLFDEAMRHSKEHPERIAKVPSQREQRKQRLK